MAKPKPKVQGSRGKPDATDALLIDLAALVLESHFFDPDEEDAYRDTLGELRRDGGTCCPLTDLELELDEGPCNIRIEATREVDWISVSFTHPLFTATVEGLWDFENEELTKAKVRSRTGTVRAIRDGVEAISLELDGSELDEEELQTLMQMLGDDAEAPRIGDDASEPPAATAADRNHVVTIAKRLARASEAGPSIEDSGWLEQHPQVLPVIAELLIAEVTPGGSRDNQLIAAYQSLLAHELELVRYRQDAGWEWARTMLDEFQQRLIEIGDAGLISKDDWFVMARALTAARVPVSEETRLALAGAGLALEAPPPPEQMLQTLRSFMDQLASMVSDSAEVAASLKESSAVMPAELRAFMTMELALSPHTVLRDAVPLMLLDAEPAVRRQTIYALEQTARLDTMSSDSLRRVIVIRNWLPTADRPALDGMIRKARLAGVEIGSWPATSPDLEFFATMIDGSGTQSIFVLSRSGRNGLFAGILLRHGEGVQDAWGETNLPRREITKMLRDVQVQGTFSPVGKPLVDTLVQHAIGTAVEAGKVPHDGLLTVAEMVGGSDWKDRRLNIAAEAERMWGELPEAERTRSALAAAYERAEKWMKHDPIIASWFEEGPRVQQALAAAAKADGIRFDVIVNDVLSATRDVWAERFTLMAMWSQASLDPKIKGRARELVTVAHDLVSDRPLTEIPVMTTIAAQTLAGALLRRW